jgi:hypothetical protein
MLGASAQRYVTRFEAVPNSNLGVLESCQDPERVLKPYELAQRRIRATTDAKRNATEEYGRPFQALSRDLAHGGQIQ